jgi:hypothetical protein
MLPRVPIEPGFPARNRKWIGLGRLDLIHGLLRRMQPSAQGPQSNTIVFPLHEIAA